MIDCSSFISIQKFTVLKQIDCCDCMIHPRRLLKFIEQSDCCCAIINSYIVLQVTRIKWGTWNVFYRKHLFVTLKVYILSPFWAARWQATNPAAYRSYVGKNFPSMVQQVMVSGSRVNYSTCTLQVSSDPIFIKMALLKLYHGEPSNHIPGPVVIARKK